MSTTFFITPVDPRAWENSDDTTPKPISDLHIEAAHYREKLKQRWNEIVITSVSFPLEWALPSESEQFAGLWGHLQEDHQNVSFGTGPKKSFLDFILWHRSFIPEQYQLFLFNSSSWDSLILTGNTTEQDIIDFTGIIS